jgi:hypothetical protein
VSCLNKQQIVVRWMRCSGQGGAISCRVSSMLRSLPLSSMFSLCYAMLPVCYHLFAHCVWSFHCGRGPSQVCAQVSEVSYHGQIVPDDPWGAWHAPGAINGIWGRHQQLFQLRNPNGQQKLRPDQTRRRDVRDSEWARANAHTAEKSIATDSGLVECSVGLIRGKCCMLSGR